jgi:hypothetical protein
MTFHPLRGKNAHSRGGYQPPATIVKFFDKRADTIRPYTVQKE